MHLIREHLEANILRVLDHYITDITIRNVGGQCPIVCWFLSSGKQSRQASTKQKPTYVLCQSKEWASKKKKEPTFLTRNISKVGFCNNYGVQSCQTRFQKREVLRLKSKVVNVIIVVALCGKKIPKILLRSTISPKNTQEGSVVLQNI